MRPFALLVAAAFLSAPAAGVQDRAIQFPDVPGYGTYVVDLHIHSVFSDGSVWPSIRVDESVRDGIDLMAVTEHLEYQPHGDDIPHPDRNRSFVLAAGHGSRVAPELLIVNGAEVTREMPPGHVNAVFIEDANALLVDDPMAAFREANRQGGFVFWNHPSWLGQRSDGVATLTPMHRALFEEGLVHGIEVANGQIYSAEALQLALDFDLAILGVSDIHGLIDWDYPVHDGGQRTTTLVFAEARTPESIHAALRANRTAAWMDNTLIGREEMLTPLLEASLAVSGASWRNDSQVIDVTLTNRSDAAFELAVTGDVNLYDRPSLVRVPPQGEIDIAIAGEVRADFMLQFEVLNAITAPGTRARLSLPVSVR